MTKIERRAGRFPWRVRCAMTAKFFPRSSVRIANVWRQPRGDNTVRVWDEASGKTIGEPMRHDDAVLSAQFSADGQRVVTASRDKTARVWDASTIRNQDAPDDVLLLADLAEAARGSVLQTSGQTEILKLLPPDQVRATQEKIATKFGRQSSGLTPVERLLKWSVSDPPGYRIHVFLHRLRSANACHRRQ